MENQQRPDKTIPIEEIVAAITKVKFGSVLVKVHQGRIQGYEVTEKKQV